MNSNEEKEKNIPTTKKIFDIVKSLLTMVVIVLFIKSSFLEASMVPTPSMEKSIMAGDFLIVNKFIYGGATPRYIPFTNLRLPHINFPSIKDPERYDVVVFEFPGERDVFQNDEVIHYVKRCIGLPGDRLKIKDRVVFINDEEIKIPILVNYLKTNPAPKGAIENYIFPKGKSWNGDNYGEIIIPKKGNVIELNMENIDEWETFINRENEKEVITIQNNKILFEGKEISNYEILNDYYFVMGDNRDNSLDSRYWGFVARDKIVGSPLICLWSVDPSTSILNPIELLSSLRFSRIAKLIN